MARRRLRIGELAAQVSLRPSALRYYEQIGLIPPPERIGGQRAYPPSTVRRIALIRMAQQAGLPLAEIRALFAGRHPWHLSNTPLACPGRAQVARDRLDDNSLEPKERGESAEVVVASSSRTARSTPEVPLGSRVRMGVGHRTLLPQPSVKAAAARRRYR